MKFDPQAMRSTRPSPGTWAECPLANAVLARCVFHGNQHSLKELVEAAKFSCPDLLMSSTLGSWQREQG